MEYRRGGRIRLALTLIVLSLTACGERAGEARLLLEDIAAGWAPSALKRTTPTPQRHSVAWRVEGRDGIGDLYLSPDGALARMVLGSVAERVARTAHCPVTIVRENT